MVNSLRYGSPAAWLTSLDVGSRHSLGIPPSAPRARRALSQPGRLVSPNVSSSIRRLSRSHMMTRNSSRSSVITDTQTEGEPRRDSPERSPMLPSFSLLGALEFQSVVSALERESAATGLGVFETGSRRGSRTHGRSLSSTHAAEVDPWDAALATSGGHRSEAHGLPLSPLNVPEDDRAKSPTPSITISPPEVEGLRQDRSPLPPFSGEIPSLPQSAPPVIDHTLNSPKSQASTAVAAQPGKSRLRRTVLSVTRTLFPTLNNFWSADKSWLGRLTAIIAVPAVLLLTLSLPVVITSDEDESDTEEPLKVPEGQLVDIRIETSSVDGDDEDTIPETSPISPRAMFERRGATEEEIEREGESDVSSIMSDIEREIHGDGFKKWLLVVQCVVGPVFVASVLFCKLIPLTFLALTDDASSANQAYGWAVVLATGVAGISLGVLVWFFAKSGQGTVGRVTRALMGFAVAMVWIMAIADEVVRVLQVSCRFPSA